MQDPLKSISEWLCKVDTIRFATIRVIFERYTSFLIASSVGTPGTGFQKGLALNPLPGSATQSAGDVPSPLRSGFKQVDSTLADSAAE